MSSKRADLIPKKGDYRHATQAHLLVDVIILGCAKVSVDPLSASYTKPARDPVNSTELHGFVHDLAKPAGMATLPVHDLSPVVVEQVHR